MKIGAKLYAKEIARVKDQFGLDKFRKGWYTESGTIYGDIAISIKIQKILFHEKSKYQDILIFESTMFGRVLVIDEIIQLTEKDYFVYEEMAAFLPLNSHPNPKKVLIIGCGDGGVAKEVLKHPLVESVTVCEIDSLVIDACKKYLPFTAKGFESSKVIIHLGDGFEYLQKHKREFDVIINDAPEPTGPAVNLYKPSYYELLKQALKPDGILLSHGCIFWIDLPVIKELVNLVRPLFPIVNFSISFTGSYFGGNVGYLLCSNSLNTNFREPVHKFSEKDLEEMDLKYYTPDIHKASLALPFFLTEELGLNWEMPSN